MKRYVIFAGVNEAGKSTLYQTFPMYQQMPRINTDEILRTFGDWKITSDVMKASKLAVQELSYCLSQVFPLTGKQHSVERPYSEP